MDLLLWNDLVYCTRMLWKARGFTFAAIAALALGIGANTAIFSVVNAVLLRPSAFPDSDRIVFLSRKAPDGTSQGAAPAYFAHWRHQEAVGVLDAVAAFRNGEINWTSGDTDTPVRLRSGQVSAKFFQTFGATLITGRFFSQEEDLPRGPKVAIISETLWQNRFNRASDITNRTIQLAGEPYAIVGVVSNTFDFRDFAPQPEVWTPFQLDPNSVEMGSYFRVAAKLHPGFTLNQANASLAVAAEDFHRKFPLWRHDQSFSAVPLQEVLVGDVRRSLWILAAAVGMVLLIACANVANLLLARGMGRKREFAIRAAIGAGRSRLIRQSLTESLLLSAAGSALGIAVGFVGIRALLKVNTADLPRIGIDGSLVIIDWRVLAFTAAVTVLTAIVFGLLPALQSSRGDLSIVLRESASRSGTAGGSQSRTRTVLVISEIALAVVLLTGAALLIRTSMALAAVDPGFDPHQVITMRTSLSSRELNKTAAVHQLIRNSVERLRALPGVESASSTCCVPLENGYGLPFQIEGRPPTKDGPYHGGGDWFTISPGYFEVMRIRMLRGRAFTDQDNAAGTPVAIINQAMAKKFWPDGADPLRDRLTIGKGVMKEFSGELPRQIIGIVSDIRYAAMNQSPEPAMLVPQAQASDALTLLHNEITPLAWVAKLRSGVSGESVRDELRKASGLPVSEVRMMDEVVSRSISRQRFHMLLMSVFGGSALMLAAIGVYALMSYTVQQRTQEIGIRMALGAQVEDVQRMVIRDGLRFSLAGVLAGLIGAALLARQISSFLYGVESRDPLVFAIIPVVLVLTALVALWIPARRATRVDPVTALRAE